MKQDFEIPSLCRQLPLPTLNTELIAPNIRVVYMCGHATPYEVFAEDLQRLWNFGP